MTVRCEPPPEYANRKWHWLTWDIARENPIPCVRLGGQLWIVQSGRIYTDAAAYAEGYRYHAPVPNPPAKPVTPREPTP